MVGIWSMIRDIDQSKTSWAVKVRAVRVYNVTNTKLPPSIECIFCDEEGSRVHAHIKKYQMQLFRDTFKEGVAYAIRNFMVQENYMPFRTTRSIYKWQFINKTEAFELHRENIPHSIFTFTSFAVLQGQDIVDENEAHDVIGRVSGNGLMKTVKNGTTKLLEIPLADEQNNIITCSLFGEMINQYEAFRKSSIHPTILVLQCFRARKYLGGIYVSNVHDVSKLIVNGDHQQVMEFRERLPPPPPGQEVIGTPTITYSSQSSANDISNGNVRLESIEDLLKIEEDGRYWTLVEIVAFDSYKEWSYISCKSCSRKVKPRGDGFYCSDCDSTEVVLRYKIDLRVMDHSSNTTFVLWDKQCTQLIGKTAATLQRNIRNNDGCDGNFPPEVEALVDMQVLFKVQTKKNPNVYKGRKTFNVIDSIKDPSVISLYSHGKETAEKEDEKEDEFTALRRELYENEKIGSTGHKTNSPILNRVARKVIDVEDYSVKRTLFAESSSSGSKKLKTFIKQEKLD